jgi:heme/copper-type cytochrome/quinol oxidase subunit 2
MIVTGDTIYAFFWVGKRYFVGMKPLKPRSAKQVIFLIVGMMAASYVVLLVIIHFAQG